MGRPPAGVGQARRHQHIHFGRCASLLRCWANPISLSNAPGFQEIFDNDHRVVSQRGGAAGKFIFTAAEAGDHKICFTPSSNSGRSGWLSLSQPNGGIRLTLDLAIGETSAIESSDKDKIQDLATRVRDLNARLNDIRREQVFQRVRLSILPFRLLRPPP